MNFSQQIQKFSESVKGNFFMPGHKGKLGNSPLDVTEFAETGNLFASGSGNPIGGIIYYAEAEIAKIFSADAAFILVNGATAGVHAMLAASCVPGDKIIVDRLCHPSVINALILCGLSPVFIERAHSAIFGIYGGINPINMENLLKSHPDAVGAIITSPTYYGIYSDIERLVAILHNAEKRHGGSPFLLVDEAHGAHCYFSPNLPQTAISQGADMAVVSTHKTLPTPTQTALLLVGSDRFDPRRVKQCVNIFQTTSPSYYLMAKMIDGISAMSELMENYEKTIEACGDFSRKINENTKAICINWSHIAENSVHQKDQTRLVINFSRAGLSGKSVYDILWSEYKIRPEMYDDNNIVCIVTVCNTAEDLDNLYNAVCKICEAQNGERNSRAFLPLPEIEMKMLPRDAFFAKTEYAEFDGAVGKICAEVVAIYPPGVAALIPGQRITRECVDYIKNYGITDKIKTLS